MKTASLLLVLLCLQEDPVLKSFDDVMEAQLKAKMPGASLAVVKDGRLVYAKGYGFAYVENKEPVTAASLFRIASLSKPVTSAAILKLAQDGKLDLDAKAFALTGLKPQEGAQGDPRLADVTVRQLLQHTGGWNREKSGDPMFMAAPISSELGVPSPPNATTIIRYMLGKPLDFEPGTRMAYSNFGYCVLGRIIEQVSGQSYENYVKKAILAPIGVTKMTLGRTLSENFVKDEVHYYATGAKPVKPVFENLERAVPPPYGGFCLEAMDSHGGWLASAVDLARFASSLDKILDAKHLEVMFARPAVLPANTPFYYGCGWMVRPVGADGKINTWHTGALPGTSSLMVRRNDGLVWVVLFNERLRDEKIDPALHKAADSITEWPKGDLFEKYR